MPPPSYPPTTSPKELLMSDLIKLISPDGKRTWSTTDRVEATNLRAQGWRAHTAPAKTDAPAQPSAVEPPEALADVPTPPADKAEPSKPRK
ncbi:hypothetical protein AAFM46_11010 [Arthrobacter sp. TMP15]|uniref:hypothetical protein n=1 Tax=Arthrobacter sp. TMP15 TaxID=3140789 RepID=UPI0031B9CA9E